ncbi:hypothetical protein pipiens_000703, partial [Culex pipiens pipiens]
MDRILGQDGTTPGRRSSDAFLCTPVLGQTRRKLKAKIDMDIETRLPSAIDDLRKWTSIEAIGDITVPPDCTARVAGNSSSANLAGNNTTQNGSPSYQAGTSASFDETDDIIVVDRSTRGSGREPDIPLDHRLPSPEEQCQMIALKFPAETIKVDTSGRRFDRMCTTRKSLLHFVSAAEHAAELGAAGTAGQPDGSDGDTIRRRSRPRRSRGKRRNTIAGTDQKEIAEVVNNGDEATTSSTISTNLVPRSKSSDILKKESPSTTVESINTSKNSIKLSHFNSLKQWGRNRLRMINNRDSKDKVQDIDDFNISDTTRNSKRKSSDKDVKLSHERKPSYSSSERSITVHTSNAGATGTSMPASINPVKLRESSSIRRQRRTALGNKDEPHSSSGNWSASSESGRTSIGSEITTTTQPKSSASSTSLNHNHHTVSSGPPSSIISRRRFLNTSASSSVTSEGTATPDLQMYDYHDEGGETSSVYSCDTEGYYTSFHVDSGLKTLKEEEPATPLHSTTALSSTTSFESSGNQTVISPENEYELFGKGSTSTTTSSAGTICTVLADGQRNSLIGPAVPERKSSLTKLNRSNSTASNGTLERSYSSSTVGSTLERTGTIKRNGNLLQKEVAALIHQEEENKKNRIESPDSGNNTSSSPIESNANSSPTQRVRSGSEFEYSESSDLECVDRIERIREKTTINTSRIPSMCIITPTNSDDENGSLKRKKEKPAETSQNESFDSKKDSSSFKKNTLLPLNSMFGKLRGVLKKSPSKDASITENVNTEPIYDVTGEYVRIADVKSSKKPQQSSGVYYSNDVVKRNLATVLSGNLNEETEYVSLNELPCNMRCESNAALSNSDKNATPRGSGKAQHNTSNENEVGEKASTTNDTKRGARVKLDAHGKVIYSSDSLKRRKGAHTTFAPGPFVKDVQPTTASPSSSAASAVPVVASIPNITTTPTTTTTTNTLEEIRKKDAAPAASNSYRSANSLKIDIDAADSYQLAETDVNKVGELSGSHNFGKYARSMDQNSDKDDGYEEISDVDFDEDSKSIARSFERLLNLSDEVFSQSNLERKSILADGSFELDNDVVECNDDELDGVLRDLMPPSTPTAKASFVMPLTPSKLTVPVDAGQHRARVLSFSTSKQDNSTDICSLNILDLSGSPKTFATRRMIRQGNFGNSSPSKIGNSSKSRGVWRYNNMRSEVMSTAIPEVHSEEDNSSPSNSTSVSRSQSQSRNTTPLASTNDVSSPNEGAERHSLEQKMSNIRDNIFLQEDENNFMKCEVATLTQKLASPATTRAQLQAQRAQFLSNNNHIKSATFKDGHYMGLSSFATTPPKMNEVNYNNEAGSNEDQQRHSPKPAAPSLETAL